MSGKILICALSCAALALFGTACDEQKPASPAEQPKPAPVVPPPAAQPKPAPVAPAPAAQPKPAPAAPAPAAQPKPTPAQPAKQASPVGVVTETIQAADKVADYGTGATQLRAKQKIESKLQKIQKTSNQQLEKEMK